MSATRIGIGALILTLGLASPALAELPDDGAWLVGFYVGNYDPEPDLIDDDSTAGVRAGYVFNRKFALAGSLGVFSSDNDFSSGSFSGEVDLDLTLLDFTAFRVFRGGKKVSPAIGGGIGGAFASVDLELTGPGIIIIGEDLEDDSLTLNLAAGASIQLGKRFWLRPNSKFRWYESRDDDEVDQEVSVAFLFRVGS
jgi:hypothetical protein